MRLERFKSDPRFRIENLFKILDVKKRTIVPLRFNEAQIKLYRMHQWFRDNHLPVRIIICKSRRAGISTGVEAIIYDDTTQNSNTNSLIVANERNPSENVLRMCATFWRHTPEWLVEGQVRLRPQLPRAYKNNPPKDRIEFPELNSQMFVATARSIDGYLGFGFQNVHATEVGYYKDGHNLFRALYPTISTDEHSSLYMESTPNGQTGAGTFFYEQCMDAHARRGSRGDYGVTRLLFIPWHEMIMSFRLEFASPEKRHAFEYTLTQAEKDIMRQYPHVVLEQIYWRRAMLAGPTFNRDEDLFDQEYPTDLATAFLASGVSVFGRKHIKRLMQNVRAPFWEGDVYFGDSPRARETRPIHDIVRHPRLLTRGEAKAEGWPSNVNERTYNNLKLYRDPDSLVGCRIFIAGDVGGGDPETKDGDFSTLAIGVQNDFGRDELIGTWRGHLNPLSFGELSSALSWFLAYRVGDEVAMPELALEWQGPGVAANTYVDKQNLYPQLYRYRAPGVHQMPKSKHIGWESNAKTKPMMIEYTRKMVELDLIDIPDETTVLEMSSYRQMGGFGEVGDFGGAAGRHDDSVSSLEILCCLLRINAGRTMADDDVGFVSDAMEDGDVPFDPFEDAGVSGMLLRGDYDDDADEEWRRW